MPWRNTGVVVTEADNEPSRLYLLPIYEVYLYDSQYLEHPEQVTC